MSQKSLESVIYYASYLIVGVDDKKKEEAIKTFLKTVEERKKELKNNIDELKFKRKLLPIVYKCIKIKSGLKNPPVVSITS